MAQLMQAAGQCLIASAGRGGNGPQTGPCQFSAQIATGVANFYSRSARRAFFGIENLKRSTHCIEACGPSGGVMKDAATIVFVGRLRPQSFEQFVRHRAGRLSLEADLAKLGPDGAEVRVTGEPDLIDAFEMACSLGPIDCLIFDTSRKGRSGAGSVAARVVETST